MGIDPVTASIGASVVGGAIGGLGKKSSKTTQTADPWKPAQPYLMDTMKQAQNLYRYGPNTVAPLNPNTTRGLNMMGATANGPMQNLLGSTSNLMMDTIAGKGIASNPFAGPNGNPYLDAIIARGSRGVSDRVNSIFSGAGRYGSGAHQGVLGQNLADYDAGLRYQNYNAASDVYQNERQNQLRAGQFAPDLAQGLLSPALAFRDIGSVYENKDAQYRNEPYDMLSNFYAPIVHGAAGMGGTTKVKEPGGSTAGGVLGGALSAFSLGKNLGFF